MRNLSKVLVPVLVVVLHGCLALDEPGADEGSASAEDDGAAASEFSTKPTPCEHACSMCDVAGPENIRAQCDPQRDDGGWIQIAVCGGIALLCDDARLGALGDLALCVASCQGGG
jgi:hypothetical protein